jgi:hypothetical protein
VAMIKLGRLQSLPPGQRATVKGAFVGLYTYPHTWASPKFCGASLLATASLLTVPLASLLTGGPQ